VYVPHVHHSTCAQHGLRIADAAELLLLPPLMMLDLGHGPALLL
jgi:hypothetical protein